MTDSHGGIGILQQIADWAANDVAATKNDSILALGVNSSLLKQDHDTLGRAGHKVRVAALFGQLANVARAKAIDVLFVSNSRSHGVLVDMGREWQLDEDTEYGGVVVENM